MSGRRACRPLRREIVSFATLLRYDHDAFRVAKLVTLGEAIKLGWRLEDEARDWVPGNSVRGDLTVNHPDLKWVDIWASYDPAPSGELVEREGSPLIAVERFSDKPDDPRIHVESRPVTNFMHLGLDHGGYFANDEGFLIPLIRHIDDPSGDGSASRFYRNRWTGRSVPNVAAGASRCCSRGAGRRSPSGSRR